MSGLTLKRTTCSIICDLVEILTGEMKGENELRRILKLLETETWSLDGGKKLVRACKRLGHVVVVIVSVEHLTV